MQAFKKDIIDIIYDFNNFIPLITDKYSSKVIEKVKKSPYTKIIFLSAWK